MWRASRLVLFLADENKKEQIAIEALDRLVLDDYTDCVPDLPS